MNEAFGEFMDYLLIDENVLSELREVERDTGDPLVSVLIDMFLNDTPRIIKEMRLFLNSGDLISMGRLAHGLKSTSGNLGMTGLMKACGDLDVNIKQNKISKADAELVLTQIEQAYPLLVDSLCRIKVVAA